MVHSFLVCAPTNSLWISCIQMWCAMYTNKHCSYSGKKLYPVVRCKSHPHADSLEIFYGCELVKAPPKKLFVDLYQTLPRYLYEITTYKALNSWVLEVNSGVSGDVFTQVILVILFLKLSTLSLWGRFLTFLTSLHLWTNNVLTYWVIEFKLESNRFIRRYDTWVILGIFLLFWTMVHTLHVCVHYSM